MQRETAPSTDMVGGDNLSITSSLSVPHISSQKQEWSGVLVEQRHLRPGVVPVPALAEHFLGIHLHQPLPIQFTQEYEGKTRQALFREGDITLLPAGQACLWQHEVGQADVLQIHIQPAFLRSIAEAAHVKPERVEVCDTFVFQDLQIQAIGRALLQELQVPGPGGRLFVESQVTVLALHILRQYSAFALREQQNEARLPSAKLQRVIDCIHAQFASDLSLIELADVAQLSPYHLLRLFKQATGQTPHRYLLSVRLHQAQNLLRSNRTSISDVAFLTGFADQSHLTRHFKRALGVTPAVFVKEQHP